MQGASLPRMRVRFARRSGRPYSLPGVWHNQLARRIGGRGASGRRRAQPSRGVARHLRRVFIDRGRRLRSRYDGRHSVEPYTCREHDHSVLASARLPVRAELVVGSWLAPDSDSVSSYRIPRRRLPRAAMVECNFSTSLFRKRAGAGLRWRVGHTHTCWRI